MRTRLLLLLLSSGVLEGAANAAGPIDYARDVKPVLAARCFSCHGALQQKAGLRLDASSLIRKGGKNGPLFMPGTSGESLLLDALRGKDRTRMPPEKEGPALSDKQIATLKEWIVQGAKMPEETIPEDPRKHWAFLPPRRAALPAIGHRSSTLNNPIDSYLSVKRQAAGLSAAGEADRATLLRRLTLDLTGLPPTPDELHVFLADNSADAYEKVVERLLDSPRHGERWARHWMDVWRYSDWYGRRAVPDVWNSAPQVHRWRDWIIHSLNADRGYERMLMEMLAGDEIATDEGGRDATGYLVRNWYALNPNQWMRDIVEHTGKAFLGLTLNCAHCHDHKYDPISQEEYFRFRAFFEPISLRQDRIAGEADPGPFQKYDYSVLRKVVKTGAVRVFDENPAAKTVMYNLGDERDLMKGKPPVTPGAPAFLGGDRLSIQPVQLPVEVWNPGHRSDFRREDGARLEAATKTAEAALAAARKSEADTSLNVRLALARRDSAKAQFDALLARSAADDVRFGGIKGDEKGLSQAASKAERLAALRATEERLVLAEQGLASAKEAAAKIKGQQQEAAALKVVEAAQKALQADSTTYTSLSPIYPKTSTGRRKALALWIASKDNPLTARVAVNHVWKHYFNRPLVETVADLGRNGAKPAHPEVLDWLAVELMESGWSLKHIHRLIVTSAAYRMQSGAGDGPEARLDPDNRLLWRFPSRRLEAEEVRDTVLFAAGEMESMVGGPSLDNVADVASRRRSLYFSVYPEGGGHHRFLELFDPPDPCDCYKRTASIVPQQALALTNSRLLLDHSRLLARKLGGTLADDAFVRVAFEHVLARSPREEETTMCRQFLRRQAELYRAAKTLPVASPDATIPPSADPRLRARESLIRVLFNHDDFLTVR